ncbi:hypothetical protein BC831DRAFT_446751 [Entophlyctis helioformis]|nr:hypothetical protein BC831DRAFT_446751 [Entophlyctis helioformis]
MKRGQEGPRSPTKRARLEEPSESRPAEQSVGGQAASPPKAARPSSPSKSQQSQQPQQSLSAKSKGKARADQHPQLTVEEAKLYDRQIRLWGMEAQQRMRTSRILVAGCTGLANEVLKNIVLAGVGSITVLDAGTVVPRDLGSQFFLRDSDVGKNRAEAVAPRVQQLNPRVKVVACTRPIDQLEDGFFDDFDLVCVISTNPSVLTKINSIARAKSLSFWGAAIMGMYGYIFSDHGPEYRYMTTHHAAAPTATAAATATAAKTDAASRVEQSLSYCSFADAVTHATFGATKMDRRFKRKAHPLYFALRVLWEAWTEHGRFPDPSHDAQLDELLATKTAAMAKAECDPAFLPDDLLKAVAAVVDRELQPACAVLGGLLAQELLKVLSRSEAPFHNVLLYDSFEAVAQTMAVGIDARV